MTDRYRLPRTTVPHRYEITLEPDLDTYVFSGSVRIDVDITSPTATIVLNAAELQIVSAGLAEGPAASIELDGELERLTLRFDEMVPAGEARLSIDFAGVLNDKLAGFYRSIHRDDDGAEHVIATTQFESTDARRAFPCFDEPDLKAVFSITLVVDEGLLAVSNGPVVADDPHPERPGKRIVRFGDTMPMSTYIVAFVVGPLVATDPVDVDGVPLRVIHTPGREHMTAFALEAGAASLRFFTDYFGLPYPGDKLDLIALPDFAFGAMENLGAVTFRETALLVDSAHASRLDHERVADVVAHEIAHMWFGDLVTMKWWNGIWLNEAFATFMELLAVDDFRPAWERWVSFSTGRAAAMVTDGMRSTRPVEFPVEAPEDAEGMFDVLTYQKGASVVRMLEQYLGGERFRSGIRLYMARHQYGNTETTDLWDGIEEATGEAARSTMDSWIFQGGYPVVSAEPSTDGTGVVLTQRRFRYLPGDDDANARWQVPVLLRAGTNGRTEHRRLLLRDATATVELGQKIDWVVVNAGGAGFYRTRYAGGLLASLTADLAAADLDPVERFNLVSDTWATVWAGIAPMEDFVELVRLFPDEDDPTVWAAILGPLRAVSSMVDDGGSAAVASFVRSLVRPAFDRVGWRARGDEGEKVPTLRAQLLAALGTFGADEEVRAEARRLHERHLAERGAVDADLVPALVAIVAETGGEADFTAMLDRYRNAATPQEVVRYLYSLARFPHEALVRRALELAASDEVRTQNAPYLVNEALGNPHANAVAWEWLTEHWDELLARFPDNSHARMIENVSTLHTPGLAGAVRSFLEAHPLKAGGRTVEQTLERLDVNVAFREREGARLARLFAE
ncbi:MAG TPA: M1 family metallopeptidase [Acidimicrobiales bacterium]|nr:M1 family metallopeptidase [Acidimicrobiales bacterium]